MKESGEPNLSQENEETQIADKQIADKMYGILDKIDDPKKHDAINSAANEFSNGNYDLGQRILEKNGFWHDMVRELAVEANQAERSKKDNAPLSFSEAKDTINGYAKSLAESGTKEDKKSAFGIESIVRGMDRPGIDGIDQALQYIEGVLQTKAKLGARVTPEMEIQWQEQRAIRDALYIEKERRSQQPERKAVGSSKKEAKTKDKTELDELRRSLGSNETSTEKIPTDERGLAKYFNDNFGSFETMTLLEFSRKFGDETKRKFKNWVSERVNNFIKTKPENGRYPDTVASVYGNDAGMLQRIMAIEDRGKITDMNTLLKMPFSEVAKRYLDIDLPEDYFNHFSHR